MWSFVFVGSVAAFTVVFVLLIALVEHGLSPVSLRQALRSQASCRRR